jgi:AcrR family transcriptional regulator
MRTHGWKGDPPRSDEEATARIIAAAMRCVARYGAKTGLSDVAADLGVTRQTVYRYFANTEALFRATSVAAASEFLDRLLSHISRDEHPADIVVEGMLFSLERLPKERYLSLLLTGGHRDVFLAEVTSPTALAFARSLFRRFPIDWNALGFDDDDLNGFVELSMRLLQSLLLEPGYPPRTRAAQRDYLHRWLSPALMTGAPSAVSTSRRGA